MNWNLLPRLLDPDEPTSGDDDTSTPTMIEQTSPTPTTDPKPEATPAPSTEPSAIDALTERFEALQSTLQAQAQSNGQLNQTLQKYGITGDNLDSRLNLLKSVEANPAMKAALSTLEQQTQAPGVLPDNVSQMSSQDLTTLIQTTMVEGLTKYEQRQQAEATQRGDATERKLLEQIFADDSFKTVRGDFTVETAIGAKGSRSARMLAVIADDVLGRHSQNGQPVTDGALAPTIISEIKEIYQEMRSQALFEASSEPNPLTDETPRIVDPLKTDDDFDESTTSQAFKDKAAITFRDSYKKNLAGSGLPSSTMVG